MIHVLFGADEFTRDQALARLRSSPGDPAMADLNTTTIEGARATAEELAGAAQAMPFLAERRLVLVRGLLERFETRPGAESRPAEDRGREAGERGARRWRPFVDVLAALPPTTVVVLIDGTLNRQRNPLLAAIEPLAQIEQFRPPDPRQLPAWIERRVKETGGSIARPAAVLLAEAVGPDLRTLANEIDKLLLYAAGRPIGPDDVRRLVGQTRETTIFELIERVTDRKRGEALRLLGDLLDAGEPPLSILFMVTRQYRLLLQLRELIARRSPTEEMRQTTGIRSDYGLQRTLAQARKFSDRQLRAAYDRLLDADRRIKTGEAEPRVALEMLIVDLC